MDLESMVRNCILRSVIACVLAITSLYLVTPLRAEDTSAQDGNVLPADPLSGRIVFSEKGCIRCHAIWAQGGNLGPDLARSGVRLSVLQLAGVLWNHSPAMVEKMRERRIERPVLNTHEMAELASFLYFLDYLDLPGEPEAGAAKFAQKGCIKCHTLGGKGGGVGPALDKYKRFASPLFMIRAMWSHGPAMSGTMAAMHVQRPRFEGRDLADIAAYIQQASSDTAVSRVYMVPGSPDKGEKVFAEKGCIKCHAVRGAGGHVGPDLGELELHQGITEIAGRMWNHGPRMWGKMQAMNIAIPQFSDREVSDLLAYLYFLRYYDPPGDAVRGQRIFMEKGCVVCHYAPAGGKSVGPDLSRSHAISSPVELCSAMWNHAPKMEALIRERGLRWPQFRDDDVRDLVAYLRSAAKARPEGVAAAQSP